MNCVHYMFILGNFSQYNSQNYFDMMNDVFFVFSYFLMANIISEMTKVGTEVWKNIIPWYDYGT